MERILTVKSVSEMLKTNPETVRRWVRDGKLATIPKVGEKSPFIIDRKSFENFAKIMPKYIPTLIACGLLTGPIGLVSGSIGAIALGSVQNSIYKKNANSKDELLDKNELEYFLSIQILKKQNEKKLKENEIQKIKVEIEGIDNEIEELNRYKKLIAKKV